MTVTHIHPPNHSTENMDAPFQIFFTKADAIQSLDRDKLITIIKFAPELPTTKETLSEDFHIPLKTFSDPEQSEVWLARDKLISGTDGDIEFRKNNELLFGKICLDESRFSCFEDCSNYAYSSILNLLEQKEFPNIIRIWNYYSDIVKIEDELERYQAFCVGRYNAYQSITEFERLLPAATAIGTPAGKFIIYFLATTKAGVQVENPRQISAYHYPKQYSPKSPSFARAMLKHWPNISQFFISGTASIVGHETLHEENVLIQLDEILKNIEALIVTVRDTHQQPIRDITGLSLMKVYIRHAEHYKMIKEALEHRVGKDVAVIYLQGDICRVNLLLEIEAYAQLHH